ncbi:MAG: NAD(P)-dependent alcohol dehydrogenase [Chloroflexota bacterium]
MRAVVRTRSSLQVQDIETPVPGRHEVLIRVYSSTVTAGDLFMHRVPRLAFAVISLLGFKYKPTPGHEFAGIVEATGADVTRFKIGDEVFGTTTGLTAGSNAEYVTVPESWESGLLAHKPTNLSFSEAAALPVGAMTAMHFLRRADVKYGQTVLIYGASGSVGSYAVQIAKHMGAHVTAVSSTRNLALMRSLGANHVIDYKHRDFSEDGAIYDVIFDAVGKISADQCKRALKSNGRFVTVRSVASETAADFSRMIELATAGHITPIIDRTYRLEEIDDAYAYVGSGRKSGNVVIAVDSDSVRADGQLAWR